MQQAPRTSGPDATPGLGVAFERPVTNLPGDDVVLFEFQTRRNSPLAGDPVYVSPLTWRDGLRSVAIRAYDIRFDDARAIALGAFQSMRLSAPAQSPLLRHVPEARRRFRSGLRLRYARRVPVRPFEEAP